MKMVKGSGNVFRDIGFSEGEAQNLLLRSELMLRIEQVVKQSGFTQQQAAKQLGITQPRLNDLLKGRIDKFSLDALVNVATRAGLRVEIKIAKPLKRAA
jgi:predicted XRE-type DNA-binding protein